jgi:hypothetical protein
MFLSGFFFCIVSCFVIVEGVENVGGFGGVAVQELFVRARRFSILTCVP